MPKVSIIIPTHNRPELLKRAVTSVLAQTYRDFEIIVVDDGLLERSDQVVTSFDNTRIKYIRHETERGGSAARNTGIRAAIGPFIAFLDDDDEWLPEKLEIQMRKLEGTSHDVGFCFSSVTNVKPDHEENSTVPDGVGDYFKRALTRFSGVLTVTLIAKKYVFDDVGYFDEQFPSHQEAELVIRIAKKYKGLGINQPLVRVNMMTSHETIGSSAVKIIEGRKLILKKHAQEFMAVPDALAAHYFQLGLFYRDDNQFIGAREAFTKALRVRFKVIYLLHYLSMLRNGAIFRLINGSV